MNNSEINSENRSVHWNRVSRCLTISHSVSAVSRRESSFNHRSSCLRLIFMVRIVYIVELFYNFIDTIFVFSSYFVCHIVRTVLFSQIFLANSQRWNLSLFNESFCSRRWKLIQTVSRKFDLLSNDDREILILIKYYRGLKTDFENSFSSKCRFSAWCHTLKIIIRVHTGFFIVFWTW